MIIYNIFKHESYINISLLFFLQAKEGVMGHLQATVRGNNTFTAFKESWLIFC